MKKTFSLLFLLHLTLSCSSDGQLFTNAICIEDITTIDPENGIKEHQTVVIQEGKILKVDNTRNLKLSTKNQIINGSGKYLIPGLWDSHVHFAYIEELAPYMNDLFLAYGITSLRDTGGEIMFMRKWKELSEQNPATTPRLMIAGPLLDGMPNVYDGSSPDRPPLSHGLDTVDDVNDYIDYLDSLGVDFLKAYEMLTPDQFRAVLAKASEKGLKVTGHVPLSMDVISASNAGLNSMEHLRNVEMSMAGNATQLLTERQHMLTEGRALQGGDLRSNIHRAQRLPAVDNADTDNTANVLQTLAKNQTVQIPTLALGHVATFKEFTQAHWQESFEYLPDTIEQNWRSAMSRIESSAPNTERAKYSKWALQMTGKAHRAGVPMMAGTDTPIGFLTPGLSLHRELELFVEAGLTPLEALASATMEPARYFGMENKLGQIADGMIADLLILNANPLESISNTRTIDAVIKDGNLYDTEALKSLKAKMREW
ncbi:MAG: amidohydrolase family protein [Roseivirga sp.]|nr:amidohydrolase family protein [Roseivirga sp.]